MTAVLAALNKASTPAERGCCMTRTERSAASLEVVTLRWQLARSVPAGLSWHCVRGMSRAA